jgi:hypothetical protein
MKEENAVLNNEAQAATILTMLATLSAANTAAATSSFIDCRFFEGDIEIVIAVGAITGSCTPSFEDATDSGGTGNAAFLPNEALSALVAGTARKYTFNAKAHRGFVKFIGTIVTGPTLIGVVRQGRPKNF